MELCSFVCATGIAQRLLNKAPSWKPPSGLFERRLFSKGTDSQLIKPHTSWILTHVNGGRDLARHAGRITAYAAFGPYSEYLSVGVRRSVKLVDLSIPNDPRPNFGSTFTPPNFTPEKTTSDRTKWLCSWHFIAIIQVSFFYEYIDFLKNIPWQRNSSSTSSEIIFLNQK